MIDLSTPPSWLSLLPGEWELRGADLLAVGGAMGGAHVFCLRRAHGCDRYLKIASGPTAEQLKNEAQRTAWLRLRRVRVPHVLAAYSAAGIGALLLGALPGKPVARWKELPTAATQAIARSLAGLHAIPTAGCPYYETVAVRLARAQTDIAQGGVDPKHFAARNANLTPSELYERLLCQQPKSEDLVIVHGDATLSNILLDRKYRVGFVDCGHAGLADRHVDLALVVDGLREQFGRKAALSFLSAYDRCRWDAEKAQFFSDLYELF